MRKIFIAGNWKMNKTASEARVLLDELISNLKDEQEVEIAVCPPYTALETTKKLLEGTNIRLGAQNIYFEDSGAFTGEISPAMLKDIGCDYVIIGHSERRQYFGETDVNINKKIKKALEIGLKPIVCIGETLQQRDEGITEKILDTQIRGCFSGFSEKDMEEMVIAYEPVWAIGTGKTATTEQAEEAHKFIRGLIAELFSKDISEKVRIQYGGSVKPDNAATLTNEPDIDGALVGGASLKSDSFTQIIQNSKKQ